MDNPIKDQSGVIEPTAAKVRRRKASGDTPAKVGLSKTIDKATLKRDMMIKLMNRKLQLVVPKQIQDMHPDKYFVWINYNRLEKSGFWHHNGYELFKTNEHLPEEMKDKWSKGVDNYIHRNEMVLAYLPMEEYKLRQQEWEVLHGNRDVTEVITNRPELREFQPNAEVEKEFVSSSGEES